MRPTRVAAWAWIVLGAIVGLFYLATFSDPRFVGLPAWAVAINLGFALAEMAFLALVARGLWRLPSRAGRGLLSVGHAVGLASALASATLFSLPGFPLAQPVWAFGMANAAAVGAVAAMLVAWWAGDDRARVGAVIALLACTGISLIPWTWASPAGWGLAVGVAMRLGWLVEAWALAESGPEAEQAAAPGPTPSAGGP